MFWENPVNLKGIFDIHRMVYTSVVLCPTAGSRLILVSVSLVRMGNLCHIGIIGIWIRGPDSEASIICHPAVQQDRILLTTNLLTGRNSQNEAFTTKVYEIAYRRIETICSMPSHQLQFFTIHSRINKKNAIEVPKHNMTAYSYFVSLLTQLEVEHRQHTHSHDLSIIIPSSLLFIIETSVLSHKAWIERGKGMLCNCLKPTKHFPIAHAYCGHSYKFSKVIIPPPEMNFSSSTTHSERERYEHRQLKQPVACSSGVMFPCTSSTPPIFCGL